MASLVSNNIDSDILEALQSTLQEATRNGLPGFLAGGAAFRDVPILGSRTEADERQFVGTPIAAIVYQATATYEIPDLNVGCVLSCEVLVACKADSPKGRSTGLATLINLARNALHNDIPSDANGFAEGADGEYHPRLRIDTPEKADDIEEPWAAAWLPVEVAYRRASDTTH